MPDTTFRVGILGAGNISDTHARAAADTAGVEVVAHWGRDFAKASAQATRHGGTAYAELEEFLEHRPMDAVLIGTPSGLHAEHAVAAARKGLHLLIEKPLDVTASRVDEIIAESNARGLTVGVFYQDRTSAELAWLQRAIAAGALGDPIVASARVKWYRPPAYYAGSTWRGVRALDGGGALMNQGSHTVDLLLWLLGDVRRVYAPARTALHPIEVEDTIVATLEFENGAIGTLEATTAAYPGYPRRIEITGSKGTMIVEQDRVAAVDLLEPPAEPRPASGAPNTNAASSSPVVSDTRAHQRIVEDFVRAVRTKSAPLCDAREGRRSVALIEAIYESARTGEPVDLGSRHRA